ncbi:MAG: F0F1 ATP synthase subunit B [Hyphomicrobiales bacterium]
MLSTPDFWVGVSFLLFIALLIWKKVPAMITNALDERAERISAELEEAKKLREEAQALLADYQRKKTEAEKEAEAIVAQAKSEAEAYSVEARKKLAESLERRTQMAEQKIAQAETAAMKEVRAVASELAIDAAGKIIAGEVKGAKATSLIDESIAAVKNKLN